MLGAMDNDAYLIIAITIFRFCALQQVCGKTAATKDLKMVDRSSATLALQAQIRLENLGYSCGVVNY